MAIPFTGTWSLSVFERTRGSDNVSAFLDSVEADLS